MGFRVIIQDNKKIKVEDLNLYKPFRVLKDYHELIEQYGKDIIYHQETLTDEQKYIKLDP